jgi:hypothetical protein
MDYLYGKLNNEIEKVYYEGKDTDTASVTVDNKKCTISVNVKEENIFPYWGTWS